MTAQILWHTTRNPVAGCFDGLPVNGDRPGAYRADGQLWERLATLDTPKTEARNEETR